MQKYELASLSLIELEELQKNIAKAIASREEGKRSIARTTLEETARELGRSVADLNNRDQQTSRIPVQKKFANPERKGETWSGRGRTPQWILKSLEAGKTLDELKISGGDFEVKFSRDEHGKATEE